MRHRDTRIRRRGNRRTDSGTISNSKPALRSSSASSPPRPKTNGSPPFQPRHNFPFARLLDKQRIDLILRKRVFFRHFARKDNFRIGSRMLQERRIHQIVVDDHLGELDAFQAAHRDQAGVARSRSHQIHFALLRHVRTCFAARSPKSAGLLIGPATIHAPTLPSVVMENTRNHPQTLAFDHGMSGVRHLTATAQRPQENSFGGHASRRVRVIDARQRRACPCVRPREPRKRWHPAPLPESSLRNRSPASGSSRNFFQRPSRRRPAAARIRAFRAHHSQPACATAFRRCRGFPRFAGRAVAPATVRGDGCCWWRRVRPFGNS